MTDGKFLIDYFQHSNISSTLPSVDHDIQASYTHPSRGCEVSCKLTSNSSRLLSSAGQQNVASGDKISTICHAKYLCEVLQGGSDRHSQVTEVKNREDRHHRDVDIVLRSEGLYIILTLRSEGLYITLTVRSEGLYITLPHSTDLISAG